MHGWHEFAIWFCPRSADTVQQVLTHTLCAVIHAPVENTVRYYVLINAFFNENISHRRSLRLKNVAGKCHKTTFLNITQSSLFHSIKFHSEKQRYACHIFDMFTKLIKAKHWTETTSFLLIRFVKYSCNMQLVLQLDNGATESCDNVRV